MRTGHMGTSSFDQAVTAVFPSLAPAEQRLARYFVDNKAKVVLNSAAQIAEAAESSDATVVRTAKALGYESLSAMREKILADISGSPSPDGRLARSLQSSGTGPTAALAHVIEVQRSALDVLSLPSFAKPFDRAVAILSNASRRHVFGIGPSGAIADYATLQFNRIGLATDAMTASGVTLADRLLRLSAGDAIMMLAYAPLYREVEIVLAEAARIGLPVVLISDSLGPFVGDSVAEVLAVPRGKADHLSMHAGTMVLVEALTLALAADRPSPSLATLDRLSGLRGQIDKNWKKRGIRIGKSDKTLST